MTPVPHVLRLPYGLGSGASCPTRRANCSPYLAPGDLMCVGEGLRWVGSCICMSCRLAVSSTSTNSSRQRPHSVLVSDSQIGHARGRASFPTIVLRLWCIVDDVHTAMLLPAHQHVWRARCPCATDDSDHHRSARGHDREDAEDRSDQLLSDARKRQGCTNETRAALPPRA